MDLPFGPEFATGEGLENTKKTHDVTKNTVTSGNLARKAFGINPYQNGRQNVSST
jgi:hypothetical protein